MKRIDHLHSQDQTTMMTSGTTTSGNEPTPARLRDILFGGATGPFSRPPKTYETKATKSGLARVSGLPDVDDDPNADR